MKLLPRRQRPRAKTFRPAEGYLLAAADEARHRGHRYIGTEHLLQTLVHDPTSAGARLLADLGAQPAQVEQVLACWLEQGTPIIDPNALAALGIDLDSVRHQLEQTFGQGALERTQAGCLSICPRAKMALAYAVDHAHGQPVNDEHILRGMLTVPDCVAARVLAQLGVTLDQAENHLPQSRP